MKRDFNKLKHKFAENYQIVSESIAQQQADLEQVVANIEDQMETEGLDLRIQVQIRGILDVVKEIF